MEEFFRISLAGKNIEVECHDRTVFRQCRNYLSRFDTPDLLIGASMEELEAEAALLSPITESYEGVATSRHYGDIESRIVQHKIAEGMIPYNIFLMHGAVVAYEQQAYMFTASSGIGKTTRIRLWQELYPKTIVVNGDKPLIKIDKNEVIACGTPWSRKEVLNTNTMVPLRAVFLLERAGEGEQTSIKEISLGQAFPFLLQQVYRPENPELMRKTLLLLKAMEGKVKFYKFRSTPTLEAVKLAYETARPE